MLKHHKANRTDSQVDPQRSHADPERSEADQNQSGAPGWRHANTGLRLIETPQGTDPQPTSELGRPWFAIAAGLLCWLVAGLLIIQL